MICPVCTEPVEMEFNKEKSQHECLYCDYIFLVKG